jgi:hypothetical protein
LGVEVEVEAGDVRGREVKRAREATVINGFDGLIGFCVEEGANPERVIQSSSKNRQVRRLLNFANFLVVFYRVSVLMADFLSNGRLLFW